MFSNCNVSAALDEELDGLDESYTSDAERLFFERLENPESEREDKYTLQLIRELDLAEIHAYEWQEWRQIQRLPGPDDSCYATGIMPSTFEDFILGVGPAPSKNHKLVRKNDALSSNVKNLCWRKSEERQRRDAEYISLQEVAARTGFSYDYVYDSAAIRNELKACWKARQWRVRPEDMRAWMDQGLAGQSRPSRSENQESIKRHFPRKSKR